MPYLVFAFLSVMVFALVHVWADHTRKMNTKAQRRFLSVGGGVAIAYVFVDLLPKLCINDQIVKTSLQGFFPFFQRHVFVMALCGFLLFFVVDRMPRTVRQSRTFGLKLASYALFNFFVGYAVVDRNDPEVQPLALFTIAMGLHYFVNDYTLHKEHASEYNRYGKWLLIGSLFLGWTVGVLYSLPEAAVALISAFIGGGVVMNVIRHELPKENPHSLGAFLLAAGAYTIILLSVGI